MRAILSSLIVAAAFGIGSSSLAGPVNGPVIESAAALGLLSEQIDCRRYPHRHKNAKPHGWGFGCPKKARPAKKKKAVEKSTKAME